MFYQGAEVGCCAIIYEEWKWSSKGGSSKETNRDKRVCICQPLCTTSAGGLLQKNKQTPTHPNKHHIHTANGDPFVLLFSCTHQLTFTHCSPRGEQRLYLYLCLCVRACVLAHTWICQCQGVGHCSLYPTQAHVSPQGTKRWVRSTVGM